MRRLHIIWISAACGLALECGQQPLEAAQESSQAKPQSWFRCHFVGTKQLGSSNHTAKLKSIWTLRETQDLRDRILTKLAATPGPWLPFGLKSPEVDRSVLLRPLLDDMIETESFCLLQGASGRAPEGALAVQLNGARAKLWQTNLWQLMVAWEAGKPVPIQTGGYNGWESKSDRTPNLFRVIQAGQWIVLGWGDDRLAAHQAMLSEIKKGAAPFATSDNWLETEVNSAWLAKTFKLPYWAKGPYGKWSLAKLSVYGKENKLRTKMSLLYPERLSVPLEAWNVPTNIIQNTERSPLISFSAAQGIWPWIDRTKFAQGLDPHPLPNQIYVWAQSDVAFQTYAAVPVENGAKLLPRLTATLPSFLNTNFPQFGLSKVNWESNRTEIIGKGLPFIVPYLRSVSGPGKDFLTAGLFPVVPSSNPPPPELIAQVAGRTNLVYYDWEITQVRLNQWISLTQLFSYILVDLAGGPRPPLIHGEINIPGLKWLQAVGKQLTNTVAGFEKPGPQEDNTITEATMTGPQELTVVRTSHLGLTGVELVKLAGWLNDPAFPLSSRQGTASANQAPAKLPSQR